MSVQEQQHNNFLDGLRSILAVIVVCYHFKVNYFPAVDSGWVRFLAGGGLAVDGFFIISGYLFSRSLDKYLNFRSTLISPIANYSLSRFKRLYPEYFTVLLVTIIVEVCQRVIVQGSHTVSLSTIVPNLLMISNICGVGSIVRDSWFVSSLFFVSILFFIIFYYLKQAAIWVVAILGCLSYAVIVVIFHHIDVNWMVFYGMLSGGIYRTAIGLALGIAVHQIAKILPELNGRFEILLAVILLCFSFYCITFNDGVRNSFFVFSFAGFLTLMCGRGAKRLNAVARLLELKILLRLYPYSYMLYLSHLLIIERFRPFLVDAVHSYSTNGGALFVVMIAFIVASVFLAIIMKKLSNYLVKNVPKHILN